MDNPIGLTPFGDWDNLEKLSSGLVYVVNSGAGVNAGKEGRLVLGETLALKVLIHARTAISIHKNTLLAEVEGKEWVHCDFTSIDIVTRAAVEAYLTFHWLFLDSNDENELDFRFITWRLSLLHLRKKAPKVSDELDIYHQQNLDKIKKYISHLNSNQYFLSLDDKRKKQIVKKYENAYAIRPGWNSLFANAGFNGKMYDAYSILADHAHSGMLSIIQLRDAISIEDQRGLCSLAFRLLLIFQAAMVEGYTHINSESKAALERTPELKELVGFYHDIGKSEWPG